MLRQIMKKLQSILESPMAISFGETILHSLWQGAIILALYWVLTKKWKTPQSKVNLGLMALMVQLVASGFTLFLVLGSKAVYTAGKIPMMQMVNQNFSLSQWISANSPYLFAAWLIGFSFLVLKYAFSLGYIQWLRNSHQNAISSKSSTAWHELTKKVSIEGYKIQLFESKKVSTAMVIGHLKPIILIPVAMVNYLSVEQLEVVLAHELAHIKRNDFLLNLFQTLAESIYFFHPIYWFIGKQIRENRELACDGLAAQWTGKGVLLAKTLAAIQLSQSQPEFAMAFGKKKMSTLHRIESLLGYQNKNQRSKFFALLLMCSMLMAFGFVPKKQVDLRQNTPKVDTVIEPAVTVLDTGIVTSRVEQTMNTEDVNIKTDNYDVKINETGIVLNGKKVEMTAKELDDFKNRWQNLQQSQREIEKMSDAIEKESSKIEAAYEAYEFDFDPSDDPNFQEYVAIIEKSGQELGVLATKMSEEIMKLDRNDKNYNEKSTKITKEYSQKMEGFRQTIQEQQPKLEKWQNEMEKKQKEREQKMDNSAIKQVEAKLKIQTDAIMKVSERLEDNHTELLNFLPAEVRKEIDNTDHYYLNYPSAAPAPPAPVVKKPMPPIPVAAPAPSMPTAPPKPKKD